MNVLLECTGNVIFGPTSISAINTAEGEKQKFIEFIFQWT